MPYICTRKNENGPVAQLNRVSDYGSEGSRFESWRGHLKSDTYILTNSHFEGFSSVH